MVRRRKESWNREKESVRIPSRKVQAGRDMSRRVPSHSFLWRKNCFFKRYRTGGVMRYFVQMPRTVRCLSK